MRHRLRPFWPVVVTLALMGCHHQGGPGVTPIRPVPDAGTSPTPAPQQSPTPDGGSPSPAPQTPSEFRIEAFFGNGEVGSGGDGGLATDARIHQPSSLTEGPDGRIYVSDFGLWTVKAVDRATGIVHHVYGINDPRDASESVKASTAPVARPEGLAFDSKGRLFVAQYGYPGGVPGKIRMIDAVGNTYTFAGGGEEPISDGAYALDVSLSNPAGIAIDAEDNLYVAENGANRILKIDPERRVTILAGTGEMGYGGDGGPATQAKLFWPQGLTLDPQGRVVFADEGNNRIRRLEADGTIVTIAGTGERGFSGDGGPATQAALNGPGAVAYDPAGNLIIADSNNNRVRRVTPDGIIQTIAGRDLLPEDPDGEAGMRAFSTGANGDNGPALEATLDYPYGLYVDPRGEIFVSDRGHRRVRVLKPLK